MEHKRQPPGGPGGAAGPVGLFAQSMRAKRQTGTCGGRVPL